MGNGDASMAQAYQLHLDLDRAIGQLSALQQGAQDVDETDILLVADGIYEALTGISIWKQEARERRRRAENPTAQRLYEQYEMAMKLSENANT